MKKKLLILLELLIALPSVARDFTYTYDGQTLIYTVLSEEAKTCSVGDNRDISGSVIIPEKAFDGSTLYSVTTIGDYAFNGCVGLLSISIPNSVTSIGKGAFEGCYGLIRAEFASIKSLCEIDFHYLGCSNPLSLAHHLYINGEEVTDLVIPNSVTTIGDRAFMGCSGLTSVTIPNAVTTIGQSAFGECSGLNSVSIGNSVTTIGMWAFAECSSLSSISIPNSVTSISVGVFPDCSSLTSIDVESGNKAYSSVDGVLFNKNQTELHTYPAGKKGGYEIPNTVNVIGYQAFYCCSGLTSITIPNSVTSFIFGAFTGCDALTSVSIPNSVTTIGAAAFRDCSNLTSITIPNSVTSIGISAFEGCHALTSVSIPNSVTAIGSAAFSNCYSLTTVTLGSSTTNIYNNTFTGCSLIRTLNINDGDTALVFDDENNSWMKGIKKLYLGRDVAYSSGKIMEFPSVTCLEIGNQVTEIGESMFSGCTDLTEVTLGSGLTTIGSDAFSGCSLTEVVVPPSVETIRAYAFADNENLSTVIMGHKVTSIGDMAYNGCPVEDVYITAQNPPTADDELFSQYTGELWVTNAVAVTAYRNAPACWNLFSVYAMIEPEEIKIEGAQTIDAAPGDTIRLTATISPDNVTLPQIFWRSTNPAIATVDNDGVVVVRGVEPEISTYAQGDDDYTEGGCRIIAESLYADAPIAVVAINSELADIEDIVIDRKESQTIDYAEPYDVYNMQGVWFGRSVDAVAPGFYIVRQGSKTAKIIL